MSCLPDSEKYDLGQLEKYGLARLGLNQYGVDDKTINELVQHHGQDVVLLVFSAFKNGFTHAFIFEILAKLGTIVLELLLKLIKKRRKRLHKAGLTEDVPLDDKAVEAAMAELFLQKLLPTLGTVYGDLDLADDLSISP